MMDLVVDHRRQQVVRGGDRMHVAGEVQVQPFHRHDLAVATAGGAAFDSERRSHRRLADGDCGRPADVRQGLSQPDRGGRLAFAEWRRRDRRHDHILRLRSPRERFDGFELDLGHVVPVRLQQIWCDAHPLRYLRHRHELCLPGDLKVGRKRHRHANTLLSAIPVVAVEKASAGARLLWARPH